MKKSTFIFISIFLIFSGIWLYNLLAPVISKNEGIVYYLKPGVSPETLIEQFTQSGLIRYPFLFSIYAHLKPHTILKAGEYYFPPGSSSLSIWRQVTQGKGFFQRSFIIVPGWSFKQIRDSLQQKEGVIHQIDTISDEKVMQRLGASQLHPEGQFFPETYYYTRGFTDINLLKRAYDMMQQKLEEKWQSRAANLPYKNPYQALIVASLVEKETPADKERPIIAGVIINRLKKNMLLQIDPTVIYGMGENYKGIIRKKDLLQDTVYNTYTRKGLPPTPIAMPSLASIEAALHPAEHQYYYFVASNNKEHQFSQTLQAHHIAVNKFINRQHSYFNESLVKEYLIKVFKFKPVRDVRNG